MEIPKHLKGIPVPLLMEPKSGVNRNYINHWWVCIVIDDIPHALYWCKGYPSAQANKNEAAAMWTWKEFVESGVFTNLLIPAAYVPQTGDGIDEIWFGKHAVNLGNKPNL